MTAMLAVEPVPLRSDPDGTLRVGATRVTLDTIVAAYREGATAEEIHLRYDSVDLADVHSVIAYYLRHRREIEDYLTLRGANAARVREQVEARQGTQTIRQRLAARLSH